MNDDVHKIALEVVRLQEMSKDLAVVFQALIPVLRILYHDRRHSNLVPSIGHNHLLIMSQFADKYFDEEHRSVLIEDDGA